MHNEFDPDKVEELLPYWIDTFSRQAARAGQNPNLIEMVPDPNSGSIGDTDCHTLTCALNKIDDAVIAVKSSGEIVGINLLAEMLLSPCGVQSIDDVNIEFDNNDLLSARLKTLDQELVPNSHVQHMHGRLKKSQSNVNLMIVCPACPDMTNRVWFIFVLHAFWTNAQKLRITLAFGLTNSESQTLEAFCRGSTLKEISDQRGRSLATIRKQFYVVMKKCGACTQAEVMKKTIEVFWFSKFADVVSDIGSHPLRRELTVLRKAGRTVEVAVAGDFDGDLVVLIATAGLRRYGHAMERRFADNGMQVLSWSRPGFGASSPPASGEDYLKTALEDFRAVLSQFGTAKVVIYAPGPTLALAVELANSCPDSVLHVLTTTPVLPGSITRAQEQKNTFFDLSRKLFAISPSARRFASQAMLRVCFYMGTTSYLKMIYKDDKVAFDALANSGMLPEIEESYKSAFIRGVDYYSKEMDRAFSEWGDSLKSAGSGVTIYEPQSGGLADPAAAKTLLKMYPHRIRYLELQATTKSHVHVYPQDFMHVIKSCFQAAENIKYGAVEPRLTSENPCELGSKPADLKVVRSI
jgi:pimeloyl-ACP methyl ester carboxylesterase/DNA-binding CsgD family transcriptional regulator